MKTTRFLLLLVVSLAVQQAKAIVIDTVPVGNVDNTADTRYETPGYGSVGYAYNIGKYEVTAGQYTAFLNAVGGVDTYALYNPNMSDTSIGSGIARSGGGIVGDPYAYAVDANFVKRPVNFVSYWDATRFANWLHNNQPSGAQGAGTTETGAYTLTSDGINNNTIVRNTNWKWAVTSEDEWYKAAYHDKTAGQAATYFDYPTSNNTAPGRDMADVSGNNANYYGTPYPIDSPYYTTLVGEFQNSDSPYGTFDQGGNVWEWNEAILYSSSRGLRGGGWGNDSDYLLASYRNDRNPTSESNGIGFRVASIPEPGSLTLCVAGVMMLMLWSRRK